jgi:hypothetical protein
MGEQNLHGFKAESGTGELKMGSFCEGGGFNPGHFGHLFSIQRVVK